MNAMLTSKVQSADKILERWLTIPKVKVEVTHFIEANAERLIQVYGHEFQRVIEELLS